jgi:hypothetical protein
MTGPKMIIDQVVAAEQVVATAIEEMQAVASKLNAQSGLSQAAMKAPAGGITATNYMQHAGAGRALAETLAALQRDLASTRAVLLGGSDQATAVASRVPSGMGGGSISSQMA